MALSVMKHVVTVMMKANAFNVNGSCLTGCDAGFKGDLCKTRQYANIEMHVEIAFQHE